MPREVIPWIIAIVAMVIVFVLIVGGGAIWTGLPPRAPRRSKER